ncbi:MAG: class I SAM-dependent methyltransferase [Pseudomonadota bacterium]
MTEAVSNLLRGDALEPSLAAIPGSFRDPKGFVARRSDGQIIRVVTEAGQPSFRAAEASGVYAHLIEHGKLIAHQEVMVEPEPNNPSQQILLAHPNLPMISYPYEWCFGQLKAAALLQLDILLDSLHFEHTLSDATAFNLQFQNSKPIFIDTLSFIPYRDGMLWAGQEQFCQQFLFPLLIMAYGNLPFHEHYRGSMTGLDASWVNATAPLRRKLSLRYFQFVQLPHWAARRIARRPSKPPQKVSGRLPKEGFVYILKQLRNWISSLSYKEQKSVWSDYVQTRTYEQESLSQKRHFVAKCIAQVRPQQLLDIGCNTGEFSFLALESGAAHVVGLESDHQALAQAYAAAVQKKARFLPLYQNLLNPSPAQGWDLSERESLKARASPDFVLALAVLHHIVISGNVPVNRAVANIVNTAKTGIIEWIPKTDPMVTRLLTNREDIFVDYNEDAFQAALHQNGALVQQTERLANGRVLYGFIRRSR